MHDSYRFRWRDSDDEQSGLEGENVEESNEYLRLIFPKLKILVTKQENILLSLSEFRHLPEDIQEHLLSYLEELNSGVISTVDSILLHEKIRGILHSIKNNNGEEVRDELLRSLNHILESFSPKDLLDKYGWLFTNFSPVLPEKEPSDYDLKEKSVSQAREKAAREILNNIPVEKILEYARTIQYPEILGYVLAKCVSIDEDLAIIQPMVKNINPCKNLIQGYVRGREEVTPGWLETQIERIKSEGNYSPEAFAYMYAGIVENAQTWTAVNACGKEVEDVYWKHARGIPPPNRPEDAVSAVEKLLNANRADTALLVACNPLFFIPSALLKRILQDLVRIKNTDVIRERISEYSIANIFNQLYERNEFSLDELSNLEIPFAPLIDRIKEHTTYPLALHRILQKDPKFFALLVEFSFKRDDGLPNPSIDDETQQNVSRSAQVILFCWSLVPGLQDDGSIVETDLFKWVETAREYCAQSNHIIGGDIEIAHILSHVPDDSDGNWPCIAARNLLEMLNNESIEEHIQRAIYHQRSVTVRDSDEGGEQEKDLAEKYRAMSRRIKVRWPRTGIVLDGIARSFEELAGRIDDRLNLRSLL